MFASNISHGGWSESASQFLWFSVFPVGMCPALSKGTSNPASAPVQEEVQVICQMPASTGINLQIRLQPFGFWKAQGST